LYYGSLAQLGEHLPYKQRVTGSSPVTPIFIRKIPLHENSWRDFFVQLIVPIQYLFFPWIYWKMVLKHDMILLKEKEKRG
jgi:hypothetical protein